MRNSLIHMWMWLALLLVLPDFAYAQTAGKSSIAEVLCTIYGWLAGPLGKSIGVLAVVAVGLAAMFGRIQLPTVLTVMTGLALIFGAQTIVQAMGINATCTVTAPKAADILASPMYHIFACMTKWFVGPLGKSLATLAIIVLGVFATYGKISYHQGLIVSAGIAAMFGASSVISNLGVTASFVGLDTSKATTATFPLSAACGDGGMLKNVFCSLVNWFNGPLGKGMATLGIIILGLGALYGKVSWGVAMIAGVGLALMFGGTTIVSGLGGNGQQACKTGFTPTTTLSIAAAYCNVINWFNGPVGKGITTLAVIIVGLGALFGKVSWTMAMVVAVGVALVFGGTTIVSGLGGPGQMACPTGNMLAPKIAGGAPTPTPFGPVTPLPPKTPKPIPMPTPIPPVIPG